MYSDDADEEMLTDDNIDELRRQLYSHLICLKRRLVGFIILIPKALWWPKMIFVVLGRFL
jgi:hypothetical protein